MDGADEAASYDEARLELDQWLLEVNGRAADHQMLAAVALCEAIRERISPGVSQPVVQTAAPAPHE